MNWLSIVDQLVGKDRNGIEPETSDTSNGDTSDEFIKPEGELTELEVAGLLSVLNSLSLQLKILHARAQDSSLQSSKISAKRLNDIIEVTISQLESKGSFEHLHGTVEEEYHRRRRDARVEKDNVENERKIRQLQLQIRSNDKIKMRDVNKKQETIATLKDEVQNLIAKSEAKMRYVDRWENARQGQNQTRCENAEMELKWQLESLTNQYNNEITVIDKICAFLSAQTAELQSDLDQWKERYSAEMSRRKEKIGQLQDKVREQQFRLQELKQLFNDRQKEMDDYLQFKEERKAEEERERFVNDSATKIQAWWRGTMVRRGLGPYKKRKKLNKEKKKKGK